MKCLRVRVTMRKASWSHGISSSVARRTSRLSMPGLTPGSTSFARNIMYTWLICGSEYTV